MYAAHYPDSEAVAAFLAQNQASLLRRILAWQEVIYTEKNLPGWLADSLINNLYLFPECSIWAQAKTPIGTWCKPEDGIFGMIESSRSCPQMECLPVTAISGLVPQLWFFPDLVRANARAWKAYQLPSGQMQFNFGLYWDMTTPTAAGNQEVMNGGNYMAVLDRYWLVTRDEAFLREFYDSAKQACLFSFEAQRPAYGLEQIVAMYEGRQELGLEILKRIQENQVCRWGGSWEAWNSCSAKADDGARSYGLDYSHNLCLWNTPAALSGEDIAGPLQPGGLADRILRAARGDDPSAERP